MSRDSIRLDEFEDDDEAGLDEEAGEEEDYADDYADDPEMSGRSLDSASLPQSLKALRACMVCSLVKTTTQFVEEGCDNCDFLSMQGNQQKVMQLTTHSFEGYVQEL